MWLVLKYTKLSVAKQSLIELCLHYCDVILGAMGSQITSVTIVYSTIHSGDIKENIQAPRHWPLCGEFTGDRWIPRTKGQ